MMKVKVFTFFILLSATALLFSCGKSGKGGDNSPAVTVKTEQLTDNSSFVTANGSRCTITAAATIDYPVALAGGAAAAVAR